MCSRELSVRSVLSSCEYWYEMMVGRLLYSSPLIISTDYDLHMTAEVSYHMHVHIHVYYLHNQLFSS